MRAILVGVAVCLLFAPSPATAKDSADYTLQVQILDVHWSRTSFGANGYGHGNVSAEASRVGFVYTFDCQSPFLATQGNGFYRARWKKADTRLEIVMTEIGSKKEHTCELKTTVQEGVYYGMNNGQLVTYNRPPTAGQTGQPIPSGPLRFSAPSAGRAGQQTEQQAPRRAGTVQELIGRAETEVRTALGEPFRIDGPRWTYQTTTGQVYLYVGGGLVTDVQPPTAMVNSIVRSSSASAANASVPIDLDPAHYPMTIHVLAVDWRDESTGSVSGAGRGNIFNGPITMAFNFSGTCRDRLPITERVESYRARWAAEQSQLVVLGQTRTRAPFACVLKTETRPTDVYFRNTTTGVVTAITQEQYKARLDAAKAAAQNPPAGVPTNSQVAKAASAKLTNSDVIAMANAGLSTDIIVAKMNSASCDFDTSPDALRQLKVARVPDAIMLEMIKRSK